MPSVAELRSGVADLATLANDDLASLWAQVKSAVDAQAALNDILPALIETYGAAAATLAADWYDDLRDEVNASGRFTAIPAEITADSAGVAALAGWSLAPILQTADWDSALKLLSGGMQRRIANASRQTIMTSSVQDPGARGWQRVARSGGCAFCQMVAGRGNVFSEKTADFACHDHCSCMATVSWRNKPVPVKPYTPTTANITDADRARVREWIAANQ